MAADGAWQRSDPRTVLALSSYFKGNRFLQAAKRAGWRVLAAANRK